jgi:hypothetical protein
VESVGKGDDVVQAAQIQGIALHALKQCDLCIGRIMMALLRSFSQYKI